MSEKHRNVLGGELVDCSERPLTGFFRDGCCNTSTEDRGSHTVCVLTTAEFLGLLQDPRQRPQHAGAGIEVPASSPAIAGACAPPAGRRRLLPASPRASCSRRRTSGRWRTARLEDLKRHALDLV